MPPPTLKASVFSKDAVEFIGLLRRFAVRFLVVGGEAVIFHGYPRLTGDIDFFYHRTSRNTVRLFRALEVFWSGDIPGVSAAKELLEPGVIVQFGRPPNRIDLHNRISGVSFAKAWSSRLSVRLKTASGFLTLYYIGLEPLRRNKRETGRSKDLDDLEHLPVPSRRRHRSR